jgi:hypothetical protein
MASPIYDGYTLRGKIPAHGPFPEVNFKYRLALDEQIAEYKEAPANTPKKAAAAKAAFLAKFLVEWDLDQPVSADSIRKLISPVVAELFAYVTGYRADEQEEDEKNSGGE